MVLDYEAHVVHDTTPTATGTKDFTVAGVGAAPVGCMVTVVGANAADTRKAHLLYSWGVTDGTDTLCDSHRSQSGSTSVNATNSSFSDGTLVHFRHTSSASDIVVGAFDSFITNGVRINFTTASTTAYRVTVVLFFGNDCDCAVFEQQTSIPDSGSEVINVGFRPSFVLHSAPVTKYGGSTGNDTNMIFGMAADDFVSTWNTHVMALEQHGLATSDNDSLRHNNQASRDAAPGSPPSVGNATNIVSWSATGFSIQDLGGPGPESRRIGGLAVRPSIVRVRIDTNRAYLTSPGLDGVSTGWKPGLALTQYGRNTANGSAQSNVYPGFGVHDFTNDVGSASEFAATHNVATTLTGSRWNTDRLISSHGTLQTTVLTDAAVANVSLTGFDLDFLNTTSAARRYALLIVESIEPELISGSAAGAATVAGTLSAKLLLEGSSAGSAAVSGAIAGQAALAGAAAGQAVVSGTLTGLAPITATSAGQATVAGTLVGRGALVATSAGVAVVAGTLVDGTTTSPIVGEAAGQATAQGELTARGALQGATSGSAATAGTLAALGALAGASGGSAAVAGDLVARAVLVGEAAGAAVVAGTLEAQGELEAAAAGAAVVSGTLVDATEGQIAGTAAGQATVSGTLVSEGVLAGAALGAAVVVGALSGRTQLEGSTSGLSVVAPATLLGLGELDGQADGLAALSGTLDARVGGNALGFAVVVGTLTAQGELEGAVFGLATVSGLAEPSGQGCFESIGVIARTRFEIEVVAPYPSVLPVVYSNELEVDGSGVPLRPDGVHCEVDIVTGANAQVATSGRRVVWRKDGWLEARVHVPIDSSWGVATDLARRIEAAFTTAISSSIQWAAATSEVLGREGAWYTIEVRCPFHVFETRDRPAGASEGEAELEDVFAMIEARLWAEVFDGAGVMVGWPNIRFEPPHALHAAVVHLPGERIRLERGVESHSRPGVTIVDLMVPIGEGDQPAVALGDLVVDSMSSVRQDGVLLEASNLERLGRAGPYYQVQVTIPWQGTVVTT
ncbi:MAG: hypothetical protein DRH08_00135 [Deltaproteobacteria bacterium]|nr:MAG: hypothetical protein DRH08_00135 [Deltaproteobacteria bacterium]